MHRHRSLGPLADPVEALHDGVRRHRTVDEEQVVVLEAVLGELLGAVGLLVEPAGTSGRRFRRLASLGESVLPHHRRHVVLSEIPVVVVGRVHRIVVYHSGGGVGPGECQHLPRDDPVEVAVDDFLRAE